MARPRVLVVDDDAAHRHTVERLLAQAYEVVPASGAGPALAAAAERRCDLAIVDIRMPGMDGFDLMGELKAADPELDVILMTGSMSDTDARLTRAIREKAFFFIQKPFHRDVLLALVGRCMELRRLSQEKRSHAARLERELAAARRFQETLLPPREARFGDLEVTTLYEPCLELGGDLCDYAGAPGVGLATLVADVAGKGVSAAMLTGMVKQAFHGSAAEHYAPAAVLQRVFAATRLLPSDRHVTAFCGRFDAAEGSLEYVQTVGHVPAFLVDAHGRVIDLELTADLLHPTFDRWRFEQRLVPFDRGACLLAYTDGLLESRRPGDDEMFGIGRLRQALAGAPRDSAAALVAAVREALRAFQAGRPPEDDVTLLAVRRR